MFHTQFANILLPEIQENHHGHHRPAANAWQLLTMLLEGLRKLLYPTVMPKLPDCHKRKEYENLQRFPFPFAPPKNKSWHFCGPKNAKKTTVVLNGSLVLHGSLVFLAGAMKAMKVSMIVGPLSTRCLCFNAIALHHRCCHKAVQLGKCNSVRSFSKKCSPEPMMTMAMKYPWPSPVSERSTALANGNHFWRHLQVKKDRIQAIATICCYQSLDYFEGKQLESYITESPAGDTWWLRKKCNTISNSSHRN